MGMRGSHRYSSSGKGVMEGVGGWRRVLSSGVTRAAAVSQDGAAPWASKPAARWVVLCFWMCVLVLCHYDGMSLWCRLVLEDGSVWHGTAFGHTGVQGGCFCSCLLLIVVRT